MKLILSLFIIIGVEWCFALDSSHFQTGGKIGNPCVWPEAQLVSITGATTGTAKVQLIALSAGKKIFVCSVSVLGVSGSSTPTFSLVKGTGTACATNTVVVMQSFTTVAATTYAFASPAIVTSAGDELCYLQTGTSPVNNYLINYVQM